MFVARRASESTFALITPTCSAHAASFATPACYCSASVTWNPYPPLPLGAIRDLLGITRALYRAALDADPKNVNHLQALEGIGKTLRAVLRADRAYPGTISHLDAWAAAERATKALGELVRESTPLSPLISATARRISRGRGSMG